MAGKKKGIVEKGAKHAVKSAAKAIGDLLEGATDNTTSKATRWISRLNELRDEFRKADEAWKKATNELDEAQKALKKAKEQDGDIALYNNN